MAFWNAPLDDEHHASHACTAALRMFEAVDVLNRELAAESSEGGALPSPKLNGESPPDLDAEAEEKSAHLRHTSIEAMQDGAEQGQAEA